MKLFIKNFTVDNDEIESLIEVLNILNPDSIYISILDESKLDIFDIRKIFSKKNIFLTINTLDNNMVYSKFLAEEKSVFIDNLIDFSVLKIFVDRGISDIKILGKNILYVNNTINKKTKILLKTPKINQIKETHNFQEISNLKKIDFNSFSKLLLEYSKYNDEEFYIKISNLIEYFDCIPWIDTKLSSKASEFKGNYPLLFLNYYIQSRQFKSNNRFLKRKLLLRLAKLSGINISERKILVKKPKKLKVAVCVSGQIRFENWKQNFEDINTKIVKNLDADIFISTWNEIALHPTVDSTQIGNNTNPFNRSFIRLINKTPESISTEAKFKKLLPNVNKIFREGDYNIELEASEIKNIFGSSLKYLGIFNSDDFMKKWDREEFKIGRTNNNMFKLAFLNNDVVKQVNELDYDIIIKLRPDYPPKDKIEMNKIESVYSSGDVGINSYTFGFADTYYISLAEIAKIIACDSYENILSKEGFKFMIHSKNEVIYNHLMMAHIFLSNNLITNEALSFDVGTHHDSEKHPFKVRGFAQELQDDLRETNLSSEEKEELIAFFKNVPTF